MPHTTYAPNSIPKDYRIKSYDTQDITFIFQDKTSGETKQLGAHKFVLALNSDVFKCQMYGTLKESGESITLVDSTFEGFQIFIDALYGNEPNWSGMDIDELLELHYLSTKYLVDSLCEVVLEAVNEHEVKKENIKDILQYAVNNRNTEKVSGVLFKNCDDFYASLSATGITDMMCHYQNNMEDVQLLLNLMSRSRLQSQKSSSSCPYCSNSIPVGKHIAQMSKEELPAYLSVGMRVVRGDDWQSGNDDGNGPGTIMSAVSVNTYPDCIKVKWDNGTASTDFYYGRYELKLAP